MSDDIISELVRMDEEARSAVEQAERKREDLRAQIEKETSDVRASYMERARRRIDRMRNQAEADSLAQTAELQKTYETACKTLEQSFSQNRERWVEEMVKRCKQPGLSR